MEIKINKNLNEYGLYSKNFYQKFTTIFQLEGDIVNQPTRESIHIGNNQHIIDKYGSFMNHSFYPNCKIIGKNVVAIKDIHIGDELTFNYNDSEIEMANPFEINGKIVNGKKKI
jgi:SET domain-containing protein